MAKVNENIPKDVRDFAEEQKEKENLVKYIYAGDKYYVVSCITLEEFNQFRKDAYSKSTPEGGEMPGNDVDPQKEQEFIFEHILYPEVNKDKMTGGLYMQIMQGVYEASGFNAQVQVVHDPTIENALLDMDEIKKIADKENNAKIITMNGIPFVLTPILQNEYIQYRAQADRLMRPDIPQEQRESEAYKLDHDLLAAHVIHPKEPIIEAGYIETLFGMLWAISGFTEDVQVLEV
jgi:hypothetical protein